MAWWISSRLNAKFVSFFRILNASIHLQAYRWEKNGYRVVPHVWEKDEDDTFAGISNSGPESCERNRFVEAVVYFCAERNDKSKTIVRPAIVRPAAVVTFRRRGAGVLQRETRLDFIIIAVFIIRIIYTAHASVLVQTNNNNIYCDITTAMIDIL